VAGWLGGCVAVAVWLWLCGWEWLWLWLWQEAHLCALLQMLTQRLGGKIAPRANQLMELCVAVAGSGCGCVAVAVWLWLCGCGGE
jgi:hypothetical protein